MPHFSPKGQAAGKGRHDLRKERAINLGPDDAENALHRSDDKEMGIHPELDRRQAAG